MCLNKVIIFCNFAIVGINNPNLHTCHQKGYNIVSTLSANVAYRKLFPKHRVMKKTHSILFFFPSISMNQSLKLVILNMFNYLIIFSKWWEWSSFTHCYHRVWETEYRLGTLKCFFIILKHFFI